MNLRVIFRSIFCLFVLGLHPTSALTQIDSKAQFKKQLMASNESFKSGEWKKAAYFGEFALESCRAQLSERAIQCINIMKNNSLAYKQAGRISLHAEAIERAYRVALSQLGPSHDTTAKIREVFYQLVVEKKRYSETIPLTIALIHHERKTSNDEHKILDWFIELNVLYKKTDQLQYEEPTLASILALTKKLTGVESSNSRAAADALAMCYCKQKKYTAFDLLKKKYSLSVSCG